MDDAHIILLFQRRDETAIAATAEKYGGYCTAIAQHILGNAEDTEECVNDTYLRAWNSIPPQIPQILSAYLGRIVRNLSFNRYKAKRTEKRGAGELQLILDELAECTPHPDTVEHIWEQKQLTEVINAFLGTLSMEKRMLFVRRYWYSDSIAELAAKSGMKEHAVVVSLTRIREKLHGYLTERGFEA